jgi:hypothetical protein
MHRRTGRMVVIVPSEVNANRLTAAEQHLSAKRVLARRQRVERRDAPAQAVKNAPLQLAP